MLDVVHKVFFKCLAYTCTHTLMHTHKHTPIEKAGRSLKVMNKTDLLAPALDLPQPCENPSKRKAILTRNFLEWVVKGDYIFYTQQNFLKTSFHPSFPRVPNSPGVVPVSSLLLLKMVFSCQLLQFQGLSFSSLSPNLCPL